MIDLLINLKPLLANKATQVYIERAERKTLQIFLQAFSLNWKKQLASKRLFSFKIYFSWLLKQYFERMCESLRLCGYKNELSATLMEMCYISKIIIIFILLEIIFKWFLFYAIEEKLKRYLVKPLAQTFEKVDIVVHKLIIKKVKAKRHKVIYYRVGENIIRLHRFFDVQYQQAQSLNYTNTYFPFLALLCYLTQML